MLGVTLLVTGVLTYMGQRALKDHRVAVERILRDNAAFAADRYVGMAEGTINSMFRTFYLPLKDMPFDSKNVKVPELELPPPFLKQLMCSCDPTKNIGLQFAYDFASGSLVFRNGDLNDGDRARLMKILREHPVTGLIQGWEMALVGLGDTPQGQMVGFAVRKDFSPANEPQLPRQYAFGFLADLQIVRAGLLSRDTLNQLMPSSEPDAKSARFSVLVSSPGREILRDGPQGKYFVDSPIKATFGGMIVRISIDPNAVPAMAGIGGAAIP